jgi:hypothetical protein
MFFTQEQSGTIAPVSGADEDPIEGFDADMQLAMKLSLQQVEASGSSPLDSRLIGTSSGQTRLSIYPGKPFDTTNAFI